MKKSRTCVYGFIVGLFTCNFLRLSTSTRLNETRRKRCKPFSTVQGEWSGRLGLCAEGRPLALLDPNPRGGRCLSFPLGRNNVMQKFPQIRVLGFRLRGCGLRGSAELLPPGVAFVFLEFNPSIGVGRFQQPDNQIPSLVRLGWADKRFSIAALVPPERDGAADGIDFCGDLAAPFPKYDGLGWRGRPRQGLRWRGGRCVFRLFTFRSCADICRSTFAFDLHGGPKSALSRVQSIAKFFGLNRCEAAVLIGLIVMVAAVEFEFGQKVTKESLLEGSANVLGECSSREAVVVEGVRHGIPNVGFVRGDDLLLHVEARFVRIAAPVSGGVGGKVDAIFQLKGLPEKGPVVIGKGFEDDRAVRQLVRHLLESANESVGPRLDSVDA